MGADQKRKEARKRKFEGQTNLRDVQQETHKKQRFVPSVQREHLRSPEAVGDNVQDSSTQITGESKNEDPTVIIDSDGTKSQRFIVFIGNLPFTATDQSIAKHFTKIQPRSIRHRTDKTTGRSKGFAFLEFEAYDRMKTCLKMYHHSSFDDGEGPARKLNVELTVGGGGAKSKDRKAKLQLKNVKLAEERQRRAKEEEKQAKAGQRQGKVSRVTDKKTKSADTGGDKGVQSSGLADLDGDIHPSRRNRMLSREPI